MKSDRMEDEYKETLIVNLFAGPGTGKSTGAAYIFSQLKLHNINCELITEVAKDFVWERNEKALADQFYICGNQVHRIFRCLGEVDVVITDSPILLQATYGDTSDNFKKAVVDEYNNYNNLNYFLIRQKPYNPKGRLQDESRAKEIDIKIKKLLDDTNIPYTEINSDETGYKTIIDAVLEYLDK